MRFIRRRGFSDPANRISPLYKHNSSALVQTAVKSQQPPILHPDGHARQGNWFQRDCTTDSSGASNSDEDELPFSDEVKTPDEFAEVPWDWTC